MQRESDTFSIRVSSLVTIVFTASAIGCVDPYSPNIDEASTRYLVVDGYINKTANEATVKVTRSINTTSIEDFPVEIGAVVSLESEDHQSLTLSEEAPGIYKIKSSFDFDLQYRLNINLKGRKYSSDFVRLLTNSPIDSLNWSADDTEFNLFLNSHDEKQSERYYRYTYEETFEHRSIFFSSYKFENGEAIYRLPDEEIYRCWTTTPLTSIKLATTTSLEENKIANYKLVTIKKLDKRLWYKYSMIVRQYRLNEEAYNYWNQLSKITESLGGLFDPIPYHVQGNLHADNDPDELVLGYFGGGDVTEKRIVVSNDELPRGYQDYHKGDCEESFLPINNLKAWANARIILTRAQYLGVTLVGYWYSSTSCADCRIQGGTNVIPEFMK